MVQADKSTRAHVSKVAGVKPLRDTLSTIGRISGGITAIAEVEPRIRIWTKIRALF